MLLGLAAIAPAEALAYDVVIRRTEHGIPHILARDWKDMGYGYAHAFAEDNICTIAASYVTVNAERSRFFGAEASWRFEGNGTVVNNLNSDFFFERIKDARIVENLLAQRCCRGRCSRFAKGSKATSTATTTICAKRAWTSSRTPRAGASRGCGRSTR